MCIISLVPLHVEVPIEAITNGAEHNSDGHGWVVASVEHGMVMGKSMKPEVAIKAALKERKRQGLNSVLLFHSRIGTHGTRNEFNVHPFYVPDEPGAEGETKTVIAHNGILPRTWHPLKGDDRSDTRVFADEMAPWYLTERGVPSRRGGAALGEMIGKNNKLVFVSTRLEGRVLYRIVNASAGTWEEGVWHSNTSFRKRTTYATPSKSNRTCAEKDCTNTFYPQGTESLCYKHRPALQRMCAEVKCYTQFTPSNGETKCLAHRNVNPLRFCSEMRCTVRFPASEGEKCAEHRPTKEIVKAEDKKPDGWVSPYAASADDDSRPPAWNGYGIYPGSTKEIDEETRTLLDDIDASLTAADGTSELDAESFCPVCRTKGQVHIQTNLCLSCKWCLDCWVHYKQCSCFDYVKHIKEKGLEVQALADALRDAEEDSLREIEAREEAWLASLKEVDPEEQVQAMMVFYDLTRERAMEIVTAPGLDEGVVEGEVVEEEKPEPPAKRRPRKTAAKKTPSTTPSKSTARR